MKKPKLHKQETNYSCSVACLRMILDSYGIEEVEKTLRIKSKTKPYGTHPLNIIECAKSYNLNAFLAELNIKELQDLLSKNIPVITNILKHEENDFYIHSVVVFKILNDKIYFLDPEVGEVKMEITLFETLWFSTNFTAIVIKNELKQTN